MVLLRYRGAKVGEKTMVHEMLDGALVALHCLLSQGEKALPNRIQGLWVHAFGLCHNRREGTGQDGDLLAFSVHRLQNSRAYRGFMYTWRGYQQSITRSSGGIVFDLHHKTIASAVDRLDHPLGTSAVPNSPTRQHNDPFQSVLADILLGPQSIE